MNEERMLKPALIAGVLLGILSSLPVISAFNCVCCAWVIGGGLLAAYLYVKDSPVPVTLGRGVLLGLLTGLIGSIVSALFLIPLSMLTGPGMGILEQLRGTLNQMPNVPPETRRMIESLYSREGIGTAIYVVGFIFMLTLNLLFAGAGSTIGVALFEKRKPGSPSAGAPPYEPPAPLPPPPPPPVENP